jgi:hypothetical protein
MWRRVTHSTLPAPGRGIHARIRHVDCSPSSSARINRWQASWRQRSRDCLLPRSEGWSARPVRRRANSCSIEPRISGCKCRGKPTEHCVLVPPILRRLSIAQPIHCGRLNRQRTYPHIGRMAFQNCVAWRTGGDRPEAEFAFKRPAPQRRRAESALRAELFHTWLARLPVRVTRGQPLPRCPKRDGSRPVLQHDVDQGSAPSECHSGSQVY